MTLLKSRTVWTIVLMFIVGGVNAVSSSIPASAMPFVQGLLGLTAIYFKVNPSQNYEG